MVKRIALVLAIVAFSSSLAHAQEKGQVGIVFKAQLIPQVGLLWHPATRFGLRALLYAEGHSDAVIDFNRATRTSMAVLYHFPIDNDLAAYVGADFTISRFENENYLGPLFGAQFQAHPRFGIFGEFGFSVDVGDDIQIVRMFNTGAGIVFYLNR